MKRLILSALALGYFAAASASGLIAGDSSEPSKEQVEARKHKYPIDLEKGYLTLSYLCMWDMPAERVVANDGYYPTATTANLESGGPYAIIGCPCVKSLSSSGGVILRLQSPLRRGSVYEVNFMGFGCMSDFQDCIRSMCTSHLVSVDPFGCILGGKKVLPHTVEIQYQLAHAVRANFLVSRSYLASDDGNFGMRLAIGPAVRSIHRRACQGHYVKEDESTTVRHFKNQEECQLGVGLCHVLETASKFGPMVVKLRMHCAMYPSCVTETTAMGRLNLLCSDIELSSHSVLERCETFLLFPEMGGDLEFRFSPKNAKWQALMAIHSLIGNAGSVLFTPFGANKRTDMIGCGFSLGIVSQF